MAKTTKAKDDDDANAWAPEFPDNKKISILVDGNPRRPGSKGAAHWKKYKEGMTIAEFRAAKGERSRLRTDLERENLKLK